VLDRIDLQIEVPALTGEELDRTIPGESSSAVLARVLAARERQHGRGSLNAMLPPARLRDVCALGVTARRLTRDAVDRGGFSARGIARALRVARTIADLAGEAAVNEIALAEALQYRAYETRRLVAS